MASILDLPPELLISILLRMSLEDVCRCAMVCTFLRDVVEGSPELQYTCELKAAGYVDGDHLTMPIGEKLRRMQTTEKAWHHLAFHNSSRFRFFSRPAFYDLSGGVFVRGDETKIDVAQFASELSDVPDKDWSLSELELKQSVRDAAIDSSADLLAIVEGRDNTNNPYRTHLRTLSGGQRHPQALLSILSHQPVPRWNHTFATTIVGDKLAVMFSSTTPQAETVDQSGELVIWDWKRGEILTTLVGRFPSPSTFSFITSNSFMIPVVHGTSDIALEVYVTSQGYDDIVCSRIASLQFPILTDEVLAAQATSHSSPAPARSRGAFGIDPLKRIFVVTLNLTLRRRGHILGPLAGAWRTSETAFTVFVHSDVFIDLVGLDKLQAETPAPYREYAWEQWSKYARWSTLKERRPGDFAHQAYGQRFIDYETGPYLSRMHLWDFNQYSVVRPDPSAFKAQTSAVKWLPGGPRLKTGATYEDPNLYGEKSMEKQSWRISSSAANPYALDPTIEEKPTVIRDKDVFRDKEVWSSLPYRRVTSREKLPQLSGIMMDGEWILLAKSTRDVLDLTVMTIVDDPQSRKVKEPEGIKTHGFL